MFVLCIKKQTHDLNNLPKSHMYQLFKKKKRKGEGRKEAERGGDLVGERGEHFAII